MNLSYKDISLKVSKTLMVYLILSISTFLMLSIVVDYSGLDKKARFLSQKQEYIHISIWLWAFYIHVFSSTICLIAAFTQFSKSILTENASIHKWVGKVYVYTILFVNFPAGLIMAYYANGFLPSKVAFFILDILWFWFTLKAVIEIKNKNIIAHRNFMIRSYALTFSAITLRTWKIILSSLFVIEPMTLYMIDAWLGFVPNILVAEWIIFRYKKEL